MRVVVLIGLLVIAASLAFLVLGMVARYRVVRVALIVLAYVIWVPAALAFGGLLALEAGETREGEAIFDTCTQPQSGSTEWPSHWSWIPPGQVCEYPSGDVGPTSWRIPAAVGLIAVPTVSLVVARRRVLAHVERVEQTTA